MNYDSWCSTIWVRTWRNSAQGSSWAILWSQAWLTTSPSMWRPVAFSIRSCRRPSRRSGRHAQMMSNRLITITRRTLESSSCLIATSRVLTLTECRPCQAMSTICTWLLTLIREAIASGFYSQCRMCVVIWPWPSISWTSLNHEACFREACKSRSCHCEGMMRSMVARGFG